MDNIKKYFEEMVPMTEAEWEVFSSCLARVQYPKKAVILEKGKIESYLSFIEKGIIRFNIPQLDYDFTFAFAFQNTFFSAYDSFLTQKPSLYNAETITEVILWRISHADLRKIYAQTSIGERIGRLAAEELYLKKMKRELSLLADSAKTRYLNLIDEQPHLIQYIPLKYLASYIGIRSQSLSRIRKQI